VTIPSVLISNEDGELLKGACSEKDSKEGVMIEFQWDLPRKEIVTLDFWTDSASREGNEFLAEYAAHAQMLKYRLKFTPYYYVFALDEDEGERCWDRKSDFCADVPFDAKVTGREVLQEDVRQLCIYDTTKKSDPNLFGSSYSQVWWKYISQYIKECPISGNVPSYKFGKECSERIMRHVGVDPSAIQKCVEDRGPTLLQENKDNKAWNAIALRINGQRFNGNPDARLVSRAVCASFLEPPPECTSLSKGGEQSGVSGMTVATLMFLLLSLIGIGLYFHHRYIRKTVRDSLREEVMFEVKTQMQDYHQMDDGDKHRDARPLVFS